MPPAPITAPARHQTIASHPLPGLPARLYRQCFRHWRVRGHMRLGTWLARLFPSMRDVTVPHHQGLLHVDLRDPDQQRIFLDGGVQFEPREVALVKTVVEPGHTVMDVGAHIGVYATLLAQLVGHTGKVLAYEPQAAMLLRNAVPYPRLEVRPVAVSDRSGALPFVQERSSGLSHVEKQAPSVSARPSGKENQDQEKVTTVTLDHEVEQYQLQQVHFLKVDVEGHEEFVLRGARRLLTSAYPPILLLEWVPFFRPRWQNGAVATLREMLSPGWTRFALGFDGTTREWTDWSEATENTNYLLVPEHRCGRLDAIRAAIGIQNGTSG
ncbi:MAG TPA: FkbM family methyltransferase [Gemmatales bacterium]|nr:FkbM family methyltransferase [Gemmatales bacterium]HMP17713.1 FkbM family methyltransferase [Gemmatales bacterium]